MLTVLKPVREVSRKLQQKVTMKTFPQLLLIRAMQIQRRNQVIKILMKTLKWK